MSHFDYPIRLYNTQMHYDWGSRDRLLHHFDVPVEKGLPQAELWIGAHKKAPSIAVLKNGERIPLDELIEKNGNALLGDDEEHGLSFLFKLLSAEKPLSIQVHPDKAQAEEGYNRENVNGVPIHAPYRNYHDANHKPELVVAISPFKALCGFRPVSEISRYLEILTEEGAGIPEYLTQNRITEEVLRLIFVWMLSMTAEESGQVITNTVRIAKKLSNDPVFDTVVELHQYYPEDCTVLSPFWLNLIALQPGEAMFLKPRCPHSYLSGTAMEVMACSDNVLRGGLTTKHVDVSEFCSIVAFETSDIRAIEPVFSRDRSMVSFPVPVQDFFFMQIEVSHMLHRAKGQIHVLFCMNGEISVTGGEGCLSLQKGDSCLLPAMADFTLDGAGRLAVVGRGGDFDPFGVFTEK